MDTLVKIYGLFLVVVTFEHASTASGLKLDEDFETLCSLRCPFQNKTDENFDAGCGTECKLIQCTRGCNLWRKALGSSCPAVCNGTQIMLAPKELHCVLGCNSAINQYFQKLKDDIGIPPAPYLVADTLTATSLSLAWEGKRYLDLSYLVQWRYEEHAGAWQYCRNQTWGPTSVVFVDNLQPFTKYRFRVALLLSQHSEPIVSKPSVVISTLAAGPPTSAPIIVRASAVDSRRISLSWKPGPFPNGPIHSYVLQLVGEHIAFKEDVAAAQNSDFYMLQNLNANSKYLVSISMRNSVGEGPAAITEISTPPEPLIKDTPQPILILGSRQRVIKQQADMLNPPEVIFESAYDITGVAIHVKKSLLFIADTNGYISVSPLISGLDKPRQILSPDDMSFQPQDLSIDWLNQHLYILGLLIHADGPMWQISRCGFDGKGLTVAVAGITTRPIHIEVDPYNGYLFWLIQGHTRGGLYRLDLANISNGIKHEVKPDIILERPHLGSFVVDHTNFCVLVPSLENNTVYSVSLDGRDVIDVRTNTQQALFRNVTSLALANGLFYWTNGREVFAEDYHEGQGTYFHNHYPGLTDKSYISVAVDLPSSQPTPVPVNPPIQVQAVLSGQKGKVTWQAPYLVGGQGKGAWQSWSYELQVKEEETGVIITETNINNTTSCTIENLTQNAEYTIKVAAYSSSGIGPWSTEFRGRTLRTPLNGKYPTILWSSSEGLLQTNVIGENMETLIAAENMKERKGSYHIVNIAWLNDMIFLVTNTSKVDWYNLTSHDYGRLSEIDSASSVAVDWIGRKLYWSNPKQQLILRGNLQGKQQEPLPIITMAKELCVDSKNAYIYWSTGHAVESARLNGEARFIYHPAQLFSGKQVMGLTLNTDDHHVYWIVRSSEGSILYKATMMDMDKVTTEILPDVVTNLHQPDMQGPLCYFSDHLLWLQDNKNAVIGNLDGKSAAVISGMGLSGLNSVAVMDENMRDTRQDLVVIPEPVSAASIRVEGTWANFNITWKPIRNVNYGDVFYEVTIIRDPGEIQEIRTATSYFLEYVESNGLAPYSRLEIAIKAFTYWGTSLQVRKVLHSPPSRPSAPENVRVFVQHEGNATIGIVRWDPPKTPNGELTGYSVKCWHYTDEMEEAVDSGRNVRIQPNKKEFTVRNVLPNSTYYFQVQAATAAGEGEYSAIATANTGMLKPIPRLLLVTHDYVKILDCDSKEENFLTPALRPIDVIWNDQERTVFWLNALKEIYYVSYNGSNKTKVVTLRGKGLSLAVDWVARYLYWSEMEDNEMTSSIHRLDLSQLGGESLSPEKLIRRNRRIHEIKVSPLTGSLFWVEVNRHGAGHLIRSRTDGTAMHTLFSVRIDPSRRQCSCPENPRVGTTFSLDQTDPYNPRIVYSDDTQGNIYSTDQNGCHCSIIRKSQGGPLPTSITTNHHHIFWSNEFEGKIYMTNGTGTQEINQSGVTRIRAIGSHLQTLPKRECLVILQIRTSIQVVDVSSTEIILELPNAQKPLGCEEVTTASTLYTLHYGMMPDESYTECTEESLHHCHKMTTYHKTVKITQLKPFSSYIFLVTLTNHYNDIEGLSPVKVEPTVVKTSAGAPSKARDVVATVLTPTLIRVEWLPPIEFNDRAVSYEVHWKTEGIVSGIRQSGEFVVGDAEEMDTLLNETRSVQVRKLIPGRLYQVWVRTYSANSAYYSDSDPIEVDTYPLPNNITLAQATPYSLEIFWTPPKEIASGYTIQYYDFSIGDWKNISKNIEDISFTRYFIEFLTPKTTYLFRTVTVYSNTDFPYIWPQDARFSFETLGDRPSRPGTPIIQHLKRGLFQVVWEPSRENGAHIELYQLEGQVSSRWKRKREANYTTSAEPNNDLSSDDWLIYYNGTENYWIMSDLSSSLKYVFRVRAKNRYGWSDSSEESKSFDYTEASMLADQQELGIVLGITLPIAVLLCVVGSILFCCLFKRKENEKKELQLLTLAAHNRPPDVELATLRELPRRGNFITNANLLYSAAEPPTDEELALLPHIRREQFKLTKFLGSGAFGEVYEGIAQGLPRIDGSTKVAIKALRKGASDQEKSEFLKEAQLMSHFKHQHILQLVGVCLDNDPNYILMELMEGGDLLSYLRANRPLINTRSGMKLQDLVDMCVDVAKGCRYLEDMHFVHRDLACRNCLVSSLDPAQRVVKIGDFGLARDIYKNDYYRKEGEGLLPVRWMAPESLVDGVFTSQSDVWSFGVLLWEIMTLGQQPYPARTNLEVLHYVRTGGRLGRPSNCSEQMHQLMLKCWSYSPESRPTFRYCLEILTALKEQTASSPLAQNPCVQYTDVRTGRSWKDDSDNTSETLTPSSPHSYLQLLNEENEVLPSSGAEYELPRTFAGAACISPVPPTAPLIPRPPPGPAPCVPPPTPETSTSTTGSIKESDETGQALPHSLPADLSTITRIFASPSTRISGSCNI